ncbi:MAG TPA: hypothetical protein VEJ68_03780 [Candidatus Bathyarchaeia archaeon]|nr:hypothetical protein [Candidatus Bathyarchaeia archaeon]
MELSKNQDMPSRKELLAFAVEDALNEMGEPTFEIISNKLIQKYHCTLVECVDKPDYLANVLKETFGHAYIAVLAKIKKNLGEFGAEQPVEEFIKVLSR